jgi:hypothetical protein
MKKKPLMLFAFAIMSFMLFNSMTLGSSINFNVKVGDEFVYELKYAKNSMAYTGPAENKNLVTTAMLKISIENVALTSTSNQTEIAGTITQKIWFMEVGNEWELINSGKQYQIAIVNTPPHNIQTFGMTALYDGEINKSHISNFVLGAPICIPINLTNSYWNSLEQLFEGYLTNAYGGIQVSATRTGSTFKVDQLHPTGILSTYSITMTYNDAGVLSSYNIRTSADPNHIIFSMQMLVPDIELQPQPVRLASYVYWLIGLGIVFIISILIWMRKRAALRD